MRKLLIASAVLLVLLVGALIIVPVFFQQRILATALEAANEDLDATVSIDGVSLSLLRSFPHPDVALEGVRVVGHAPFEGVELATIEQLRLVVGLGSLTGGGAYEIRKLVLDGAAFDLQVDPDGRANWDIVPSDDQEASALEDEPAAFALDLRDLRIDDLALTYNDSQSHLLVDLDDLDHRGSGSVSGDLLTLDNTTSIAALTVRDGAVTWLKEVGVQAEIPVSYNQASGRIDLDESSLELNDLRMGFAGSVESQGDDLALDLSFRALESAFASILSLVPGVYTEDFADIQTAGTLALEGSVKGVLPAEGDDLPGFDVKATVADASFQMPDLPTAVTDIRLDLAIAHPGGDPDGVQIDLDSFRMAVAGSPIGGSLKLRQPVSDPDVDLALQGRVDLAKLRQALPLEGVDYAGVLDLDVAVAGRVSHFERNRFDQVTASGRFALQDAVYSDAELPVPVEVSRMSGSMSPRSAELSELVLTMGDSDLSGTGRLDNLVAWFFTDDPLEGEISVRSARFDTNPWLADDGEEEAGGDDQAAPASSRSRRTWTSRWTPASTRCSTATSS